MGDTRINQLTAITSLNAGDLLPVFSNNNGDARKISIANLVTYFEQNFANPTFTVLTFQPSSGNTIHFDGQAATNLWGIISPGSGLASLVIALPTPSTSPVAFDGQTVLVSAGDTFAVAALSYSGTGGLNIIGAPDALARDGFFALRYNLQLNTWFCVENSAGSVPAFAELFVETIVDVNGNEEMVFVAAPLAVNHLEVTNAASGDGPTLASTGDDANVSLNVTTKGTGRIHLAPDSGGAEVNLSGSSGTVAIVATNGDISLGSANGGVDVSSTSGSVSVSAGDELALNAGGAMTVGAGALVSIFSTGVVSDARVDAPQFKTDGSTVAALGAATAGKRAHVTDANAALTAGIGTIVAAGGANVVPVFADGTNWRIG